MRKCNFVKKRKKKDQLNKDVRLLKVSITTIEQWLILDIMYII